MNNAYARDFASIRADSLAKQAVVAWFAALFLASAAAGYSFAALRAGQDGFYPNFHNVISYVASLFTA